MEDCPVMEFTPVCLEPPPIPAFPEFGSVQTHYTSSWFEVKIYIIWEKALSLFENDF